MGAAIIIAFIVFLVAFVPEKRSYNESWEGTSIATKDLLVTDKPRGKIIGLIDQGDEVKLTGNVVELRSVDSEENSILCEIWYNRDEHITAWVKKSGLNLD